MDEKWGMGRSSSSPGFIPVAKHLQKMREPPPMTPAEDEPGRAAALAMTATWPLVEAGFRQDSGPGSRELPRRLSTFIEPMALATLVPLGSTKKQQLQSQLLQRPHGGPQEQALGGPLRKYIARRCFEVQHSSMEEPLCAYKSLEASQMRWPHSFRRFHLTDGIRVTDNDTIVVSARDHTTMTKTGRSRASTGHVTFSHTHLTKLTLDSQELGQILAEHPPGGAYAWTLRELERVFRTRTGRTGCWSHYGVPFADFINCFPKSIERFGSKNELLRLRTKSRCGMLERHQEIMTKLAQARLHNQEEEQRRRRAEHLPDIRTNRFKAVFRPSPLCSTQQTASLEKSASLPAGAFSVKASGVQLSSAMEPEAMENS